MSKSEPAKGKGGRPKGKTKSDPWRAVRPGRPELLVPDDRTLKAVREFGMAAMTFEAMARHLGVSLSAFNGFRERWPEVDMTIEQGRAQIDLKIATVQLDVALKGKNTQMLIHLGKNRLGQADKVDTTTKGDISINIDAEDAEL